MGVTKVYVFFKALNYGNDMVLRLMPNSLSAYGLSDPGLVRENNEDVWGCLPEFHFYALADGMGGHQAGEVASKEAIMFLCQRMRKKLEENALSDVPAEQVINFVKSCIEDTNHFVNELSRTSELLQGMGTTLCCLYFQDDYAIWAHVGDSRIYRFRKGAAEQLTQDHSLLRELIDCGRLQNHEKEEFLYKNIITKAIGTDALVEPAINLSIIAPGDTFLLCTDGLSDMLSKDEMLEIVFQPYTVEEKVRALIGAAKQKGGYDNITCVLVEVTDTHDANISRQ
jgi:PPM family protein phosphatase